MYVYVYAHTCTYTVKNIVTYMHACIHIYIYIDMYIHMHSYTHPNTQRNTDTSTHATVVLVLLPTWKRDFQYKDESQAGRSVPQQAQWEQGPSSGDSEGLGEEGLEGAIPAAEVRCG